MQETCGFRRLAGAILSTFPAAFAPPHSQSKLVIFVD
jgi:hypothetical protein